MPARLDLSATYAPSDMLVSSPNHPRLSLRRAASYQGEKGLLSSTSSRFNFDHLITSPPLSPGLPALVPRHGKPAPRHRPRKCLKGFLWLMGVVLIAWYGLKMIGWGRPSVAVGWATHAGDEYEMVGESELPEFPTPVVVTDKRGRAKWTVSIPPNTQFPLPPKQYAEICQQSQEVSKHVAEMHRYAHIDHAGHFDYYFVDKNFLDVAEAEAHGLLPGQNTKVNNEGQGGSLSGENKDSSALEACPSTMTFVLESRNAGLGTMLMQLWTAYGLAQEEGRDFFIDDTRWAYGKYTDYFQPPPIPNCKPPPRHEMLPCPRHARHLVVSAATHTLIFGGAFHDHYEDPKKMEVRRLRPIFSLARQGYEKLFHLAQPDAEYVESRIKELVSKTRMPPPEKGSGIVIGVHVRHGDRRPYEFQYKDSYIPLDVYMDEGRELLHRAFNESGPHGGENMMAEMKSIMTVASDDPDVYDSDEFSHTARAQERIKLASKQTLQSAKPTDANARKFVEETVGWEGGFFAGMFWSLGRPSGASGTGAGQSDTKSPPSQEALRLRELVGRAYLMDLAVLGQASNGIVCTVSAVGCRLLAVMMGWERSIEQQSWVNVDGAWSWRGVNW